MLEAIAKRDQYYAGPAASRGRDEVSGAARGHPHDNPGRPTYNIPVKKKLTDGGRGPQ